MASSLSLLLPHTAILRTPKTLNLRTAHRPMCIKARTVPALTQDELKKLAADKAVEYVKSGMVLGLGTGSTAAFVVSKLGELLKSGELTNIVGVPTSKRTEDQARSLGIPLSVLDDHPKIDLAIDGADEVDPNLDLVKGRGGALLREKMVEAASDKFVVVADETKLVPGLGGSGLAMPVEVVQFCWKYNLIRLQELFKEEGVEAKLRLDGDKPYVTDNFNYIVDLYFKTPIKDGAAAGKEISVLEGVVEHGLFLDMATAVIIADNSTFAKNLNSLLNSLPSNASVSKLYNTSFGNDPDKVFALYMCLDYLTLDSCHDCINMAQSDIATNCSNSKEAVVWEENCQLRYSNQNFFGILNVNGNIPKANVKNISDPEKFEKVVNKKLSKLAEQAAFSSSLNMYATGEVPFGDKVVYALVQCTTDLSGDDCHTCLERAIEDVLRAYNFSIGARLLSLSCYLRYEFYPFYKGATSEASVPNNKGGGRKVWLITIIAFVSACLGILLVVSFICLAMIKTKKKGNSEILGQQKLFHEQNSPKAQEYPYISLASIHAATNKFSDLNKLGEGGFGPVYKGVLRDGKEVAIKRLSSCSEQGLEEFTNEVLLMMKLQHKNLVRLLGFCAEGEEKLLVYEYMPNSSLDVILFDSSKRTQLDWSRRVSIVNGIARAILYLHEDSRLRIIHRDLKASNVLLDNEMNPKISDFGMARIFAGSEGQANTAIIVGTYGYMAPEYAMEGLYSVKSDVFGFGVLLLEIITGTRNAGFHLIKRAPSLIAYAWKLWDEGKGLELIDPSLISSCDPEEFLRYLHIGLLCVQEDANDRPTMSSAVVMLKSETVSLNQPGKPAFSIGAFSDHHNKAGAVSISYNNLTISNLVPR